MPLFWIIAAIAGWVVYEKVKPQAAAPSPVLPPVPSPAPVPAPTPQPAYPVYQQPFQPDTGIGPGSGTVVPQEAVPVAVDCPPGTKHLVLQPAIWPATGGQGRCEPTCNPGSGVVSSGKKTANGLPIMQCADMADAKCAAGMHWHGEGCKPTSCPPGYALADDPQFFGAKLKSMRLRCLETACPSKQYTYTSVSPNGLPVWTCGVGTAVQPLVCPPGQVREKVAGAVRCVGQGTQTASGQQCPPGQYLKGIGKCAPILRCSSNTTWKQLGAKIYPPIWMCVPDPCPEGQERICTKSVIPQCGPCKPKQLPRPNPPGYTGNCTDPSKPMAPSRYCVKGKYVGPVY